MFKNSKSTFYTKHIKGNVNQSTVASNHTIMPPYLKLLFYYSEWSFLATGESNGNKF